MQQFNLKVSSNYEFEPEIQEDLKKAVEEQEQQQQIKFFKHLKKATGSRET